MIQRKCFQTELETKANLPCDSHFQKSSEKYRLGGYMKSHVTNHNNINIIFIAFSANTEIAHLVINR